MQRLILASCASVLIALSASAGVAKPLQNPSPGRGVGEQAIDPRVAALFAQYPHGGPDLTNALTALLAQDPGLARDVVAAARRGSLDQKVSAGTALAQAQKACLAASRDGGAGRGACNDIARSLAAADPQTVAAYEAASGETVASDAGGTGAGVSAGFGGAGGVGGGGGGGGTTTTSTVSPN